MVVTLLGVTSTGAFAAAGDYGPWGSAVRAEAAGGRSGLQRAALDGCPFISRDGKIFYMASNRNVGLVGSTSGWRTRASVEDPRRPPGERRPARELAGERLLSDDFTRAGIAEAAGGDDQRRPSGR
jgi:hypothetical protein